MKNPTPSINKSDDIKLGIIIARVTTSTITITTIVMVRCHKETKMVWIIILFHNNIIEALVLNGQGYTLFGHSFYSILSKK